MESKVDLDPLSRLIQQANFCLMGKSRSYVYDSQTFARALIDVSDEFNQMRELVKSRADSIRTMNAVLAERDREIERLEADNRRLVDSYAEALVRLNGTVNA